MTIRALVVSGTLLLFRFPPLSTYGMIHEKYNIHQCCLHLICTQKLQYILDMLSFHFEFKKQQHIFLHNIMLVETKFNRSKEKKNWEYTE